MANRGGEKTEEEREKGQEITKVETNGYYRRIKDNRKSGLEWPSHRIHDAEEIYGDYSTSECTIKFMSGTGYATERDTRENVVRKWRACGWRVTTK